MKQPTIALIGNPNSGKTTVFNGLTGAQQRVGNWSGVTVEKKVGHYTHQERSINVVDLPGTYSLLNGGESNSLDERIACDYLLTESPDLLVNIVDASNLERNLYLSSQLLGLGVPLVIVLNMMDVADNKGLSIDTTTLARQLGAVVVEMSVHKRQGLERLRGAINQALDEPKLSQLELPLGECIDTAVSRLSSVSSTGGVNAAAYSLMTLECGRPLARSESTEFIALLESVQAEVLDACGEDADLMIADARYGYVHDVVSKSQTLCHQKASTAGDSPIDRWVLNRFLGIPIFFAIMYLMFLFSINVGGAFQDFFDIASDTLFVQGVAALMSSLHMPAWTIALLADGLGKGLNTTLTFIPVIGTMFLFLSFLEASGYMARAAFVMDRLMRAVGLPGKAFVPMIVGFGCNVPAIMSARTLDNQRDRILTVMMSPFMSCSARLAIFTVFIAAFFPVGGQNVVFALYLLGILMAILTGFALRKTLLRGSHSPLIMELPPYHWPQWSAILRQTWARLKHFLSKAGKIILPVCVLIGGLNTLSVDGGLSSNDANSLLSELGRFLTPLFAPMGIHQDNWPATVGLLMGMLAKEVVVATLNTLYSQMSHASQYAGDSFHLWLGLKSALYSIVENLKDLPAAFANPILASAPSDEVSQAVYGEMARRFDGQAGALAYLIFVLLYVPCVSTMAVIRKELSFAWMTASVLWSTGLAYAMAVIFYQTVTLSVHPGSSIAWLLSIVAFYVIAVLLVKYYSRSLGGNFVGGNLSMQEAI